MWAVGQVMKHAAEDPKHAEWWLARKFPERWADRSRQQLTVAGEKGGEPLTVEIRTIGEGE
jgi:hypothetical protein